MLLYRLYNRKKELDSSKYFECYNNFAKTTRRFNQCVKDNKKNHMKVSQSKFKNKITPRNLEDNNIKVNNVTNNLYFTKAI